jgi:hypothetical protein
MTSTLEAEKPSKSDISHLNVGERNNEGVTPVWVFNTGESSESIGIESLLSPQKEGTRPSSLLHSNSLCLADINVEGGSSRSLTSSMDTVTFSESTVARIVDNAVADALAKARKRASKKTNA